MSRVLSQEEERELALDYKVGKATAPFLAYTYNVSVRTVYRIVKKHNANRKPLGVKTKDDKPKSTRLLQPCGTDAAYRRHLYNGERPCISCVDAHNIKAKEYKIVKPKPNVCGTDAGYARHRRKNEPACESCLKAHNHKNRFNKRRRKRESNKGKQ